MSYLYPCWYCDDESVGKFTIRTLYFKVQHPGFLTGVITESRIDGFGILVPLVPPGVVEATFYPCLCQPCLDMFSELVQEQIEP